jgi:hypothetical protein
MTAATLVLYAKLYAPHSHTAILMTLRHPALAKNLVRRCQFLLLAIHFIHVTRALRRLLRETTLRYAEQTRTDPGPAWPQLR